MSYHIIDISTNGVTLSAKDGQFVCRNPDNTMHKLPMEDVGAVLVNTFSACIHNSFLVSAAKHRVAVVICDKFRPVSMVLPVQRATDTLLTRAQIQMPMRALTAMWRRTVDAKCANQYDLVSRISADDERLLQDFRIAMQSRDVGKEGVCARCYWSLLSKALKIEKFRRERDGDGLNGLLNYGYAVLLLRVEQKLLGCGLDPLYGMGHYPRERSMPLAYDIMEPFRPVVDEMIYEWVRNKSGEGHDDALTVTREYKQYIQGMVETVHGYEKLCGLSLDKILELVIRSFRVALTSGKEASYRPWIRRSSRWAG